MSLSFKASTNAKHMQTAQPTSGTRQSGGAGRDLQGCTLIGRVWMKDALKGSPLFLHRLAYKGVCFPFRTQGHEIIHAGDLKATQRGRNSSTKLACVPLNCLARMQGPTQIPTHSHANARARQQGEREKKQNNPTVVPFARLVSVSVVWQWESWHHPAPFPPPSSAATAELFCLRAEWAHWVLGDFCLSYSLSSPVSLQLVHVAHRCVALRCVCFRGETLSSKKLLTE